MHKFGFIATLLTGNVTKFYSQKYLSEYKIINIVRYIVRFCSHLFFCVRIFCLSMSLSSSVNVETLCSQFAGYHSIK